MTSTKLSMNEWATVRTALRMLRNSPTLRESLCESPVVTGPTKPLTSLEIDDLCDRLYFCAVPFSFVGRGRPVDDAVSFENPALPLAKAAG
jgi:hypothetical protein